MNIARLLPRLGNTHRTILTNASSLVGTTGVTSVLGAVYWLLAARQFPATSVGFAAAAVSTMMLLGSMSILGFGTLLVSEFPRHRGQEGNLISTALVVTTLVGMGLGAVFAMIAPWISNDLQALASTSVSVALFALGVGITALTAVLDQALIGLLRGELQFVRNVLFGVAKLGILGMVGIWLSDRQGIMIYATWVIGNLASVIILAVFVAIKRGVPNTYRPQLRLLRGLGRMAIGHHVLNLALQAPGLLLPLLVTALLSAKLNASFYVAWMVAGFIFVGSRALTTGLYAVSAAEPETLAHKLRFTLKLALVMALLANVLLLIGAEQVLSVFGHTYVEQAGFSLRILGLAAIPLIIRDHYIAVCRIQGKVVSATKLVVMTGIIELSLAAGGAHIAGLLGLSLGWFIAVCVEALIMTNNVYRASTIVHTIEQSQTNAVGLPPTL